MSELGNSSYHWQMLLPWLQQSGLSVDEIMQAVTDYQKKDVIVVSETPVAQHPV
jgi:hypothetical protein